MTLEQAQILDGITSKISSRECYYLNKSQLNQSDFLHLIALTWICYRVKDISIY